MDLKERELKNQISLKIDKNEQAISSKDQILFGSAGRNLDDKMRARIVNMLEDHKRTNLEAAKLIKSKEVPADNESEEDHD